MQLPAKEKSQLEVEESPDDGSSVNSQAESVRRVEAGEPAAAATQEEDAEALPVRVESAKRNMMDYIVAQAARSAIRYNA